MLLDCSYQDVSRLAISNLICLFSAIVFLLAANSVLRRIYDLVKKQRNLAAVASIALLSFVISIIGMNYGANGVHNLVISSVCRKTSTEYSEVFLTDGDVPIDNNASERAIRGFCLGKKNWQVIDTVNGAKTSAMI